MALGGILVGRGWAQSSVHSKLVRAPFPRTTPCRARALLFLSLPLPNLPTPLLLFLSLPLPATPAHLCPATPAHPFLPTRSHHTPHLRSVCCEVLSASRDCGCPGCDGILGIRMTDPQAGRRRWSWPISAISRDGLLWWSGSCRHHFSTSPDFSVRRPPCLCCNLGSIAPMSEKVGVNGGRDGTAGACAGCGVWWRRAGGRGWTGSASPQPAPRCAAP